MDLLLVGLFIWSIFCIIGQESNNKNMLTGIGLIGKTSYTMNIANQKGGLDGLKFEVRKKTLLGSTLLLSGSAPGQKPTDYKISTKNTTDDIYVRFFAPSHFIGNIK